MVGQVHYAIHTMHFSVFVLLSTVYDSLLHLCTYTAGASSGKKEKLSNKAKRKLQKEEEAKDREVRRTVCLLRCLQVACVFH